MLTRLVLPSVALAWLCGLMLAPRVTSTIPALAALGAAIVIAYVGRRARARTWTLVLLGGSFAAGWVAGPRPLEAEVPGGLAHIEGRIERVRWGASARAVLHVERAQRIEDEQSWPPGTRVIVWDLDAAPGTRVRLLGIARPRTRFLNPTPHPEWLRARPIHGSVRLRAPPRVLAEPLTSFVHQSRAGLRGRLNDTLPPSSAGVARALLLGDGDAVERQDRDAIRGAGLAHLLAVSGLHVALFAGFVVALVRRIARGRARDPGRVAALSAIPASIGFAIMAGGAPSAWRAATMASVAAVVVALRRRPDPLGVASLAAIGFALSAPDDAVRPAFLLSILATVAIVTTPMRADAPPSPWAMAWQVSVRTTVATAPLVVWCFGDLPVLGIVANVVLVPIAVVVLVPLAFVHALASGVGLDAWTAPPFTVAVDALVGAADVIAEVGWGLDLPPPSTAQGLVLCAGAVGLLVARSARRIALVALASAMALTVCEVALRHVSQPIDTLRLTQIDVAQGDGALVDLPDGSAMLVDAGGGIPDPGERAVLPLLQARRRDHLRLAIISHPHPDHYRGLVALLDHVQIDEVWDGGQAEAETPHGPASRLLRSLRRRGVRVRQPPEICGMHRIGGAELEVLWPCPGFDAGLGLNDNSLVLRARHGARSMLFTGDVERLAEEALVASPLDLRADVLKVPHHGSRTSSSDAFLERVAPIVAIASQGRRNRYGHPHPSVVERYARRRILLLRTDRDGGVIVETDGDALEWRTYR